MTRRAIATCSAALALAGLAMLSGCLGVGVMGQPVGSDDDGLDWSDEEGDAGTDESDGGATDEEARTSEDDANAGQVTEGDAAPEHDTGPIVDEEDAGAVCTYPAGPYGFDVNQVVEPMSWSGSVAIGGDGVAADLEVFHCDPEVRSIFLYVGNTT